MLFGLGIVTRFGHHDGRDGMSSGERCAGARAPIGETL